MPYRRAGFALTPPSLVIFVISLVLAALAFLVHYAHVSVPIISSSRVFDVLSRTVVEVRLVADIPNLSGLSLTTTNMDGLPVIGLRENSTPVPERSSRFPNTIACTVTAVPPCSEIPRSRR